jgi:asparagine synthase (glutamine-hydrolysing)
LEVRVPLLDKQVLEASEQLYSELGMSHVHLKHVLKQELAKYLPESKINQIKTGFMPPIHNWVNDELSFQIKEKLNEGSSIFRKGELNQILRNFYVERSSSTELLWAIYVLLVWIDKNK